ncbi:unnamed protein product [Meganyctiphanes norvegica]|uniref:Uncharacterized protein n=1 Tax=Meganyctiphanes norvegica TaxID=48144 RepID=A0AAV2RIP4_MEGNR
MRYILYICTYFGLTFGLVYGDDCKERDVRYTRCSVYNVKSKKDCNVAMNNGDGNFEFYIKPLSEGKLVISLHKRDNPSTSTKITSNLFTTTSTKYANKWYKIKISKGGDKIESGLLGFGPTKYYYYLKVNDQKAVQSGAFEPGNEIRVKTVASLWTSECDPRQYEPIPPTTTASPSPSHPVVATQSPTQPTKATETPSPIPQPPRPDTATNTSDTKSANNSVWQVAIIVSVSLALFLVIVIAIVILVRRHKRRTLDPALIKTTEHQNRLSRHVSENSLYGCYDNQGAGENQVPHDSSATNNATNSATTSAYNSANQRRGSAHDSENSLYGGIN